MALQRVIAALDTAKNRHRILISTAVSNKLTYEKLQWISAQFEVFNKNYSTSIKIAHVASADLAYGDSRVYAASMEAGQQVRSFRTFEEAERWVLAAD